MFKKLGIETSIFLIQSLIFVIYITIDIYLFFDIPVLIFILLFPLIFFMSLNYSLFIKPKIEKEYRKSPFTPIIMGFVRDFRKYYKPQIMTYDSIHSNISKKMKEIKPEVLESYGISSNDVEFIINISTAIILKNNSRSYELGNKELTLIEGFKFEIELFEFFVSDSDFCKSFDKNNDIICIRPKIVPPARL